MDFESDKDIVLDFIDEQQHEANKLEKRLSIQSLRDQSHINFNDLLERQWTLSDQSQPFFHSKQQLPEEMIPELLEGHNISGLKARDARQNTHKQIKEVTYQPEMKNIFTIFNSPQYVEDIQMYLSSETFAIFIRIVVIINFVGLFLTDYTFRMEKAESEQVHLILDNALSLNFEAFANCVFTLQIILQMFSSKTSFSNPWIILNLIGTIACWSTIFFDMIGNDDRILFEILHILRIIRGIRIIEVFENLKNLFEVFLGTVPSLNKIFFPLLVFMSFYAITGQHLFLGANQYKCRTTQKPVDGIWTDASWDLCGAGLWTCPEGTYCGNPYDQGLPESIEEQFDRSKQHGLVGFNNFFRAMLTVYHYVFLSNWSGIIFKFSKYINPYLTVFYFVSMAVVLFFILANLVFISLSKAYLEKEKLLEKKRQNSFNKEQAQTENQQPEQQLTQTQQYLLKIIDIFQIVLIVLQCVVIVIDYKDMSKKLKDNLSLIDFFSTVVAIVVVFARAVLLKSRIFKKFQNFVDFVMILCFLGDVIFCLSNGYSVIYIKKGASAVLRAIKIIRIIKILYVSESIFKYERNIVNLFFETLKNMRYFLLLLACIVMIFSFIGEMLFAYRVRFNSDHAVDITHGQPYVTNFESSYKSIISTVLLFENERWTQTMYTYYSARGFWAILFFASVAFFVHLMLTRLFMAVFLCYFRRDLQKKFEQKKQAQTQRSIGNMVQSYNQKKQQTTVIQQCNETKSISSNSSNPGPQNNSINSKCSPRVKQDEKIMWVFDKNSCLIQIIKIFHNSKAFYYFILGAILVHLVTIVFRSNVDSEQKTSILNSIQNASIGIYCAQFALGVLSYGFYFETNSYLKRSHFNKLNLAVIILLVISVMPFIDPLYQHIIKRLIVIKIFTVLKSRNKQMDIILKAIAEIFKNFLRVLVIYIFFLIMASVIPLKLLKNSLYNCVNPYTSHEIPASQYHNAVNCMNAGGDWVEDAQNFNNIFNAVVLMYQVVTSQSWTYFIQLTIFKDIHWDIFFVLIFFFYNVCLLNIFVGLIVETYIDLKDKAYKLNLLRPSQRGWILIKNCINELVPLPTIGQTNLRGFVHQISFKIVTHEMYNNLIDLLAYVNIILYAMTIYRSSQQYQKILLCMKIAILLIFSLDTLLTLFALRRQYFYLENSKVQLVGFIYAVFYGLISTLNLTNEQQRIVEFCLVIFLFLRCKKFLFRFTWSKTLINSVIEILPKCIQIGKFLFIVMFVYVAVGLELFKHVKPTSKSDGYTTGFNNFFTGLMTLLKIASNQSWFQQVTVFLRDQKSHDVCYQIFSQADAQMYPGMGCGNWIAIPFLLSYHVAMGLLILNLLIATMVSAYDQNYEKQYNSVNVFQLQDCLQLWKKYDPKGTGVIPYKKFWKLSSQIGILFGISKKKLIKSKQKFLEELDIPICQSINPQDTSVLCYRFHDVITKFSKIKLQVSLDKGDENSQSIEFDIHPMIENEIKDYTINIPEELYKNYVQFKDYTSGEMKYFFGLLRKLRSWKTHSKSKGQIKVSKLSRIIKVAMEKKVQQENLKNLLAFCTGDDKELIKKRSQNRSLTGQNNSARDKITQDVNNEGDHSSNQSESQLVQSQPLQQDEVLERSINQCFDFELIKDETSSRKKNG